MNISIKGTHLELTETLKQQVEEKIGHLDKFLQNMAVDAKVELERDRHHHKGDVFRAEVTMLADGKILRADALGEDVFAALDLVIPKLKEQISKLKNKRLTLERQGARRAKQKK